MKTKKYVDYIIDATRRLLAVDSPTGYTKDAADFLVKEYRELGYKPQVTVKGGVLVDLGGEAKEDAIVFAAHTDTLGAMVCQIKGNGRLQLTPLGGMNPNNAEAENCRVIAQHRFRRGSRR